MDMPIIVAHGELGALDEVMGIGVVVIFLIMMSVSWIQSRNNEILADGNEEPKITEEAVRVQPDGSLPS